VKVDVVGGPPPFEHLVLEPGFMGLSVAVNLHGRVGGLVNAPVSDQVVLGGRRV